MSNHTDDLGYVDVHIPIIFATEIFGDWIRSTEEKDDRSTTSASSDVTHADVTRGYHRRLDRISQLESGWDGKEAQQPSANALEAARHMLDSIVDGFVDISPLPSGKIAINVHFRNTDYDNMDFEIRIEDNGMISGCGWYV